VARILIPLPALDFDPSEAAVSWRVLTGRGHAVSFATPDGAPAIADDIMLTGRGLGIAGPLLRANAAARDAYAAMAADPAYRAPIRWDQASLAGVDGLLLPGGHRARGMRPYLESETLQALVVQAFGVGLPVAAICHGVLLAARSRDPATGRSVLHGRRTTALTWALERAADGIARRLRRSDPGYYRTYPDPPGGPEGFMSVQAEVTRALAWPKDFLDVADDAIDRGRKRSGTHRDTATDARPAFVVRDGSYVSARWPGDAHTFAATFAEVLEGAEAKVC
jgi:putative intracellular protease/amidase